MYTWRPGRILHQAQDHRVQKGVACEEPPAMVKQKVCIVDNKTICFTVAGIVGTQREWEMGMKMEMKQM